MARAGGDTRRWRGAEKMATEKSRKFLGDMAEVDGVEQAKELGPPHMLKEGGTRPESKTGPYLGLPL